MDLVGDHTKLVPKKINTANGVHKLEEGNLFVEVTLNGESISLKGITPPQLTENVFLVKTFQVFRFEGSIVLWQVAEGLINGKKKVRRFGYDDAVIGKIIYNDIAEMLFSDKKYFKKEPTYFIVSEGMGKMFYKEVVVKK